MLSLNNLTMSKIIGVKCDTNLLQPSNPLSLYTLLFQCNITTYYMIILTFTHTSSLKITYFQQKLPRDLHIVVIDLPGHGDTTIPDPGDKVKLKNMVEYVHQVRS